MLELEFFKGVLNLLVEKFDSFLPLDLKEVHFCEMSLVELL